METATFRVKAGLAQMLKGGVIMDVVTAEHAKIAEDCRGLFRDGAGKGPFGYQESRRCSPHVRSDGD